MFDRHDISELSNKISLFTHLYSAHFKLTQKFLFHMTLDIYIINLFYFVFTIQFIELCFIHSCIKYLNMLKKYKNY